MKYSLLLLLLSGLFFFSSCNGEDDDMEQLYCEILVDKVIQAAADGGATHTEMESSEVVRSGSGLPTYSGCVAEFQGVFFNMDQLISYRVAELSAGNTLILTFP